MLEEADRGECVADGGVVDLGSSAGGCGSSSVSESIDREVVRVACRLRSRAAGC